MLFWGGEGVCKKSMVCMLMKMMFKKMTTPYETSYEIATSEDFIGLWHFGESIDEFFRDVLKSYEFKMI